MSKRSGVDTVFVGKTDGVPMIGLTCYVYDESNNLATIYETRSGGALKANPFITASATGGQVAFYTDPGFYEIEVSDTQVPARFSTRRVPVDGLSGGTDGIDLDQIDFTKKVKAADIDLKTYSVEGSVGPSLCSQVLAPGTYHVNAMTKAAITDVDLTFSGGSVSVNSQQEIDVGSGSGGDGEVHLINAIIAVTATTTMTLTGTGLGTEYGYMTILGIGA